MVSWACVAYLTLNAMRVPHRGVLFQTQKDDKVIQLVEYAKCLYAEPTAMAAGRLPADQADRSAARALARVLPPAATSSEFPAVPTRFAPITPGAT